jgi:acyl-CoA thioesterase
MDFPHPADLDTIGFEFDPDNRIGRFELVPRIARHDGGLYGGTAIAASVVAMEAATQRGVLWLTTQFVATSRMGDVIECTTDVLAAGRNVTQVQTLGRSGDKVLFVSIGSTATPRDGGLEGQFESMPAVTPPEDTGPMAFGFGRSDDFRGFTEQIEYRMAGPRAAEDGPTPLLLWSRLIGERPLTAAGIAFMADMIPGAIARTAGKVGGGASLDNSLRFGRVPEGEQWILLELRGQLAVGSHAHGSVRVWTRDGALLAVGSQSANMMKMVDSEESQRMAALLAELDG